MFGRLVGCRLVFFLISELVRLFVWLDEGQMKKEKEYLGVTNAAKSCVFFIQSISFITEVSNIERRIGKTPSG